METLFKNKTSFAIVLLALAIGVGMFSVLKDLEKTSIYLFAICSSILVMGFLFFNLKWYYFLLIGLIPISIDAGFIGGAKLNFPAEGLLTLMLPVLFLFNKEYRGTVLKVIKHPISILLIFDLLIELLSGLLSSHIDVSLKRIIIRFLFISGFYILINLIKTKNDLVKPWVMYMLGLVPVIYFTMKNHIHYSFNPRVVFSVCQPYFNDHTVYGACLAFVIPLLTIVVFKPQLFKLSKTNHLIIIVVYFLIVVSEVLALSRASILSLLVATGFYFLLRYKVSFRTVIIGLLLIIITGISFQSKIYDYIRENDSVSNDGEIVNHFSSVTNVQSDASNLERINRWICAYRMFEERPLLGYGPGTYQFEYNQFQTIANKTYISTNDGSRGNAHSEYLTYLSEMGIIGFLIFLLTVFSSIYYGMVNHYNLKDPLLMAINLGSLVRVSYFLFSWSI